MGDKQTTAQTPALFNMRTSTQLLSGLGFLALLAPASAQSSSSIESSIESSFESSSTILPSSQSSSETVSTTELSSTTGASSSSEVSSTQTSSEVSSFTTPSSSLSTSFVPSSSTSESSLSSLSSFSSLSPFSSVASSSTTVNVTTSSTSSSTSSSATPTGSQSAPFFLTIQTAASKRRQLASGSYLAVVNGQLIATDACNVIPPTAFTIDADRLRAGDSFATATAAEIAAPGYSAVEFAAVAAAGDGQTVFAVDAVAGLSWTNAVFLNGAADFCLLNNVVQAAYTVPIASIADCVPVNLVSSQEVCETPVTNIIIGVEISIEITIINVVNVINGATVTAPSTETKTVRHPMTRTSGPVVTSSVGSNGTVYYTTTVACVQCQCPGYVPGQLTVIATKSVCPVCVASTVTPVTATVIPCATCAALVPGTVTQTGGGKPSAYTVLVPATTAAGTPGQQTPVVTATAVAGNPTSPVTYTGAASSISAKGAVFGIVVGLFLSLC